MTREQDRQYVLSLWKKASDADNKLRAAEREFNKAYEDFNFAKQEFWAKYPDNPDIHNL